MGSGRGCSEDRSGTDTVKVTSIDADDLSRFLSSVECVLFDFDGPICDLFANGRAPEAAHRMVRFLVGRGLPAGELTARHSPADVLQDGFRYFSRRDPAVAKRLVKLTAHEEREAARLATPTDELGLLLQELAKSGCKVAIATNNSPQAVKIYLEEHALVDPFRRLVYGRKRPARMKPDPDCLSRAMRKLGVAGDRVLMLGDSPADAEAAARAEVLFVGFCGGSGEKRAKLEAVAVDHLIDSLSELRVAFQVRRAASGLSR
jgi:phosphoglycolate phosphatase